MRKVDIPFFFGLRTSFFPLCTFALSKIAVIFSRASIDTPDSQPFLPFRLTSLTSSHQTVLYGRVPVRHGKWIRVRQVALQLGLLESFFSFSHIDNTTTYGVSKDHWNLRKS
jgi:hypothetical protein